MNARQPPTPRFVRLAETERPRIAFEVDGRTLHGLEGDTLLVALLLNTGAVRDCEFGDGKRAGFCMMAACQDCWIWTAEGARVRACSTPLAAGMRFVTEDPWLTDRAT